MIDSIETDTKNRSLDFAIKQYLIALSQVKKSVKPIDDLTHYEWLDFINHEKQKGESMTSYLNGKNRTVDFNKQEWAEMNGASFTQMEWDKGDLLEKKYKVENSYSRHAIKELALRNKDKKVELLSEDLVMSIIKFDKINSVLKQ